MSSALHAISVILPLLYLGVALLFGMKLGGPRAPSPLRLRWVLTGALILAQLAWFGCQWQIAGHFPVSNAWVALGLLAFTMVLISLAVEVVAKTAATASMVVGTAFVIQLLASCFAPLDPKTTPLAESPFFVIHVATAVCALAAILLSSFYGGLYLILLREIRSKRFGFLFRSLPDLNTLSRMNRGAASAGFVLLTVGLNLGIWWAHDSEIQGFSYLDPMVLTVLALWIVFGLIGLSKWLKFLSGRRAARVAVLGLGLVVLSLLISIIGLHSFHSFA